MRIMNSALTLFHLYAPSALLQGPSAPSFRIHRCPPFPPSPMSLHFRAPSSIFTHHTPSIGIHTPYLLLPQFRSRQLNGAPPSSSYALPSSLYALPSSLHALLRLPRDGLFQPCLAVPPFSILLAPLSTLLPPTPHTRHRRHQVCTPQPRPCVWNTDDERWNTPAMHAEIPTMHATSTTSMEVDY